MSEHTGRLSVDFIACDGLGYCAKELPKHIRLDDWGYPILTEDTVTEGDLKRAKRAMRSCPVEALRLELDFAPDATDPVDPKPSFRNPRRRRGAERSRV